MKNQGKIFENNFKASLDLDNPYLFYYRFKDSPSSFGNQNNQYIRFTGSNICDNMIFYKGHLFLNELKVHRGKSLPLSCIRDSQFKEMSKTIGKKNVHPLLIIFFSDLEITISLDWSLVNQFRANSTRKSISLSFCEQYGKKINSRKLQSNYRYNVVEFLENYIENKK